MRLFAILALLLTGCACMTPMGSTVLCDLPEVAYATRQVRPYTPPPEDWKAFFELAAEVRRGKR
jgi:hypothetical protein